MFKRSRRENGAAFCVFCVQQIRTYGSHSLTVFNEVEKTEPGASQLLRYACQYFLTCFDSCVALFLPVAQSSFI